MSSGLCNNSSRSVLEVYLLGLLEYEDALRLQRRLVYDVSGAEGRLAALILCEHNRLISIGRAGSRGHVDCDDEELSERRLPIRWVNRGGGCNLHSPGQLAAYPIFPVHPDQLPLGQYLRSLEQCVAAVLHEFRVTSGPGPVPGSIWTRAGQIASVGVAVSRWVSYHGFTLNVSERGDAYRVLRPHGRVGSRFTTLNAERQRPIPMAKVRECVVRRMAEAFGFESLQLHSQHPLLQEQDKRHVPVGSASC